MRASDAAEQVILDQALLSFIKELDRIREYLDNPSMLKWSTSIKFAAFTPPPAPNFRISLGDGSNTYYQFYNPNPPNLIQRFFVKMVFGITMEKMR